MDHPTVPARVPELGAYYQLPFSYFLVLILCGATVLLQSDVPDDTLVVHSLDAYWGGGGGVQGGGVLDHKSRGKKIHFQFHDTNKSVSRFTKKNARKQLYTMYKMLTFDKFPTLKIKVAY